MQRIIVPGAREFIGHTIRSLPARLQSLLKPVDFLVGLNPNFVGLHDYTDTDDDRSYAETSHVAWKRHQDILPRCDQKTTVVLTLADVGDRIVLLHEIGHALDEQLGFTAPDAVALDSYAARNRDEAIATAFQSWATPRGPDCVYAHNLAVLQAEDPRTVAFWDSLCREGRQA